MHMYICMSLPCRAAAHVLSDHIAEPEPGAARRAQGQRVGALTRDGAGMHPTGQPRVSRSRSLSIPATSSWARLMSEAAPPGSLRLLEEGALAGVVCRASPAPIGSHGLFAPDSGVPILSIAAVS